MVLLYANLSIYLNFFITYLLGIFSHFLFNKVNTLRVHAFNLFTTNFTILYKFLEMEFLGNGAYKSVGFLIYISVLLFEKLVPFTIVYEDAHFLIPMGTTDIIMVLFLPI